MGRSSGEDYLAVLRGKSCSGEEPWRSTGSSSEELETMVQGECEIRRGSLLSHGRGQSPRGSSIVTDHTTLSVRYRQSIRLWSRFKVQMKGFFVYMFCYFE